MKTVITSLWMGVLAIGGAAGAGCAAGMDEGASTGGGVQGTGGSGGATTTATTTGVGGFGDDTCGVHDELGDGVPPAARELMAEAPSVAAPFVFDPPTTVVLPEGWPSPRFLVHTTTLPSLAQLELTVGGELIGRLTAVPTPSTPTHLDSSIDGAWWEIALTAEAWDAVRCRGNEIAWAVRYRDGGGAVGEETGSLSLLLGAAEPDLTYLSISEVEPSDFRIRRLALSSTTVQTLYSPSSSNCIGCHTATPDGQDVVFQRGGWSGWRVEVGRPDGVGDLEPPPYLGAEAQAFLDSTPLMFPAVSAAAWSDETGHFFAAVTPEAQLAMVHLDAAGGPTLALSSSKSPSEPPSIHMSTPAFAPDASRIVFVGGDQMVDGYFDLGASADLWQIPVTLGSPSVFGQPQPLVHASDTPHLETFPTFSPDGELLAFARMAPGTRGYDEPTAEIWIMRADDSAPAVRVAANDAPLGPAVYAGDGLTSSWPRFGETIVTEADGTKHYFLLFSSRRGSGKLWEDKGGGSNYVAGRPLPRLYLAIVTVHPGGQIESHPAALVPGQLPTEGAHTPSFVAITSVPVELE